MKNKRYLGIIALLLVVAMALSACAQDPVVDGGEKVVVFGKMF